MTKKENFLKGFVKENPIFVFLLGMCPSLATTTSLESAFGMGILVLFVLIGSNCLISLLKNFIPNEIRIPAYIVIIATFVTIIKMLCDAFAPALANSLGVFISLIVVNCIILGRAEAFASKNNVLDSFIDAISMGLGFTMSLMIIGLFRELLGTGAIAFGKYLPIGVSGSIQLWPSYAIPLFVQSPGAFFVLGIILAIIEVFKNVKGGATKWQFKHF